MCVCIIIIRFVLADETMKWWWRGRTPPRANIRLTTPQSCLFWPTGAPDPTTFALLQKYLSLLVSLTASLQQWHHSLMACSAGVSFRSRLKHLWIKSFENIFPVSFSRFSETFVHSDRKLDRVRHRISVGLFDSVTYTYVHRAPGGGSMQDKFKGFDLTYCE